MNLEVVRRQFPCRHFANWSTKKCRSCQFLTHIRPDGTDTTYCGHRCDESAGWFVLLDTHPEDIDTLERCTVCYGRIPDPESHFTLTDG